MSADSLSVMKERIVKTMSEYVDIAEEEAVEVGVGVGGGWGGLEGACEGGWVAFLSFANEVEVGRGGRCVRPGAAGLFGSVRCDDDGGHIGW